MHQPLGILAVVNRADARDEAKEKGQAGRGADIARGAGYGRRAGWRRYGCGRLCGDMIRAVDNSTDHVHLILRSALFHNRGNSPRSVRSIPWSDSFLGYPLSERRPERLGPPDLRRCQVCSPAVASAGCLLAQSDSVRPGSGSAVSSRSRVWISKTKRRLS